MAKQTLPTNFKDDILNASMQNKRKYRLINNTDGTVSLEDVTTYDQVGSNFGAGQINATNTAVNASADASKIIDSLDVIAANTQKGYMAGALALKEVSSSLVSDVYVGDDGKLHKVIGGADTVLPFKSKSPIKLSTGTIYGVIGSLSDLRTLLSIDVSNYSKITSGTFTKAHYGYVYLYGDSTILKSITSRNGSQSINLSGIDISKYKNLRFAATNDSSVANASITNLVIE